MYIHPIFCTNLWLSAMNPPEWWETPIGRNIALSVGYINHRLQTTFVCFDGNNFAFHFEHGSQEAECTFAPKNFKGCSDYAEELKKLIDAFLEVNPSEDEDDFHEQDVFFE